MDIQGHLLNDGLAGELVHVGAVAGQFAVAHATKPGATKRLFALEAYLRATELALPALEAHGYATRHIGSALVGSKDRHELQFATARGLGLTRRGEFDPFTSKLRMQAASINSRQAMDVLPGLPEASIGAVIHVVWSFSWSTGLVAAHAGMLMPADRAGEVRWLGLTQLPYSPAAGVPAGSLRPSGYQDQASSEIRMAPRPQAQSDAG